LPGAKVRFFGSGMASDILGTLSSVIRSRRNQAADTSYTRQLLDSGPERCARKLGEEALETVIAGVSQGDQELKAEAADLLYHLLVLLESRHIALDDVLAVLAGRMGVSGVEEKAARPQRVK
jgi:phosphoribosyl-ATP pyrophosphohydrolase